MKKLLTGIAVLLVCALPAFAGMDSITYTLSPAGIGVNATSDVSYVIRGVVESVYVDSDFTATTGTVTITDSYGTIFTKACTADAQYYPRAAAHTTAGAAMTWTGLGSDAVGLTSNTVTTTQFYEKMAVAGEVKVTVVQSAELTGVATNDYSVTILFDK